MLVYRVVPGYWGTRISSGWLGGSSEDAFYDLGYINMPKGPSYFKTGSYWGGSVNSFTYKHEECKYFFLFPWDALLYSKYIGFNSSFYSNLEISILEYDIPGDILIKYLGFGYYHDLLVPEFCIPINILKDNNPIIKEYDEELINKILDRYQERSSTYFEKIKPYLKYELIEKRNHPKTYDYYESLMKSKNKEELLMIYEGRLEPLGNSFKCSYITNRYSLFWGKNAVKLLEQENITEIFNGSFLTKDTYQEWLDYYKSREIMGDKDYIIENYLENAERRLFIK